MARKPAGRYRVTMRRGYCYVYDRIERRLYDWKRHKTRLAAQEEADLLNVKGEGIDVFAKLESSVHAIRNNARPRKVRV